MCCNCVNRRQFLGISTGMLAGAALASAVGASAAEAVPWQADTWDPNRPFAGTAKPLRVLPILMYTTFVKREKSSWKSWGSVGSDEAAGEEAGRIAKELAEMAATAGFPIEVLPVVKVKTTDEAERARETAHDVVVVYPATGSSGLVRACLSQTGASILFVRHRSGPVYYWYEALSTKLLSTGDEDPAASEKPAFGSVSVDDVVVDDYAEVAWRLRALSGVRNFVGTKIVALGGPWGKYAPEAPDVARANYKMDIIDVSYDVFAPRIEAALTDAKRVTLAESWTDQFLAMPGVALNTERAFVVNAFLLYGLFKDLMIEHDAPAFTIKECMSTILPMSDTTACLTLGLLNDEGLIAFCESDFVAIPAGLLLHYIAGTPVFLHNSTFPHAGIVTCAHCSAPRRMDSVRYEPVNVVTHYESEFGAAPKVEIPKGQEVTFIDPEYATGRWLSFRGVVEDNPFLDICRSQQDVRIQGDWKKLLKEVRDSHWVMVYGNRLREVAYASRKIGVRCDTIEEV